MEHKASSRAATPCRCAILALLLGLAASIMGDAVPNGEARRLKAVFTDLDGTLVHFPAWFEQHGTRIVENDKKRAVVEAPNGEKRVCRVLPSSTMGPGMVSERTVALVDELRAEGVLFIAVTAARKSTLEERQPLLPQCDALVCETGSRILVGGELDRAWAASFEAVSGSLESDLDPAQRPEPLWRFFRELGDIQGLKRDSRSYWGCFRVDTGSDEAVERELRARIASSLPSTVDWAMNLGKFDFFPALTGKGNAVAHLQRKFGLRPEECACLFDDDNDLPMAMRCGYAQYLPGLTSDSVRRAAAEHPEWVVAKRAGEGVFAVEECLEALLDRARREKAESARTAGAGARAVR